MTPPGLAHVVPDLSELLGVYVLARGGQGHESTAFMLPEFRKALDVLA
jgi:hypothetical protein